MREFWKREWPLWAFLAVAVALTAAAGSYNVRRMVASKDVLQTTRATHADVAALLADAVDAETGHRGYLLTGRDEYLEPFREADARVWGRTAALRERVSAHPRQGERLDAAERLIREKFDEMRRTIALRDTAGREAAAAGVAEGQGKRAMDGLRAVVRDMLTAEEGRLEQRTAAADAQYRTAELTNVLAAILSLGILAGVATLTRRDKRRRERLAGKLADAKAETDAALGRLDAFLHHAPYGIAYFDPDLRFVRVNDTFARTHGVPIREHLGRPLTAVLPQYPPDLLADYRRVMDTGTGFAHRLVRGPDLVWEVTAFAVPDAGGRRGLGVIGLNVTDRQRAEEQLRLSEARLRRVFESNVVGMIRWDLDRSLILDANAEFLRMTGYTRDDLTSGRLNFRDMTPAEWTARNEQGIRVLRADGQSPPYEKEYFRKDGSRVPLIIAGTRFEDSPAEGMSFVLDISEVKRVEERLRASEARFRTLTDTMPQIVWTARPDGDRDSFNARWYEYTGLTPAQSLGRGWVAAVHPDDVDRTTARWADAISTGRAFDLEYRLRRHDGGHEWFLARGVAVRDDAGRIVRWLGTSTGIDEKVKTAQALRLSEERFRAMADGIPQLAWMGHPDGHLFWYNQRWHDYTGTTLAEMDGWGWEKVHDPVELPRVTAGWRAALAAGEPFEDTFPLRRHDGQMRWHLTRAIPRKDADGRVLLWFGTNTDVTDQRNVEARLRELADAMPQIVWTARPDGSLESFNARWYEYTGKSPDDSLDWAWGDILHPDDVEPTTVQWVSAVADADEFECEYRLRRHDGEYEWFLGRGLPVRDEGGAVVRWLGTSTGIDEKVKAARALQASEARFRELADAMPQIVYALEPDGRMDFVNRQWVEYTGQPTAAAADLEAIVPAEDRTLMAERWARAFAAGTPFETEFRLKRHADGAYRWFLSRTVPVRDADGRVTHWYGTSTDIHDQKRAEQGLRDAASQLRQLTEGMPLLMWACRPTGECDYLSRQWTEYTGAALDEQLGYGWLDALHPDDRAGTAEAWQHAVRASGEYDIAFRLRRHDGEYRWFAVRGIPLRDPGGRIVRWYGSCTDIDDRKRQATTLEQMVTERTATLHRTNASLREQQIFLDAILNSVAEGIVACDGDGRLKLFNAATRRMHGLPAEPLPPDRWAEHYRLFEADGVTPMPADRVPLARAWAGEDVRDAEMMLRTAGGADRYVLVSGVQLRTADGGQFGAVVSMRDMTERREYERQLVVTAAALKVSVEALKASVEALQASNEALAASNEELEKFAYIASHDLQEPLRKIQAFGTRLAGKHRDALGDQGKEYIDRMLDSAGRMRKLIEDLLAFSRVATKAVSFDPVDLTAVVRDVLLDLEVRVQQSGGRVEVGPLPFVRGDASQLRQVFQNLIGNALKFARPGVPPVVRVTAVPFHQLPPDADPAPPDGTGWRIAVADNGIGFEQGYAERIFELFQRLHARIQYEGTGLGLAIVRKIVVRYGATIAARSTPNAGAAFLIDWPLRAFPSI